MSETGYRSHHDSRSPTGWAERQAVLFFAERFMEQSAVGLPDRAGDRRRRRKRKSGLVIRCDRAAGNGEER